VLLPKLGNRQSDLAVIIVSWNVKALLLNALRALYDDLEQSKFNASVWVVDNASQDGTAEAVRADFPKVNLIASEINVGFAAGNNLALRALGFTDVPSANPNAPKAVFLLNPDTLVHKGAVRALYQALFKLPKAGMVGARLSYEDGAFQHSAFRFPNLPQLLIDLYPMPNRLRGKLYESSLNGRYPRQKYNDRQPFPIDHPLGASMMLRREAIEQTGLFDEAYFMYVEEVDWCWRIRKVGWQIYAVPNAHIVHLEGRSTKQARTQSVVNLWRSRRKFFFKNYKPKRARWLWRVAQWGMRFQMAKLARQPDNDQHVALRQAYQTLLKPD
jgi:N-acetylglucosaminyl-diphospho-decaprenol L-rhamnosyltransferase